MSDAFAHLSPADQRRAEELAEQFRAAGAEEPEAWAMSEIEENIPQLARFLFLRRVWRGADEWTLHPAGWFGEGEPEPVDEDDAEDEDELPARFIPAEEGEPPFLAAQQAVERILAAGVAPEDLQEVARAVFLFTAFNTVQTVDDGHDPHAGEGMPGWFLAEVGGDLVITSRTLDNLHEDLFTTEPDGRA